MTIWVEGYGVDDGADGVRYRAPRGLFVIRSNLILSDLADLILSRGESIEPSKGTGGSSQYYHYCCDCRNLWNTLQLRLVS